MVSSEAAADYRRMMYDDAPDVVVLSVRTITARKPHVCMCKRMIATGDRYRRTVYKDNDDGGAIKTGRECVACITGNYDCGLSDPP